MRRFRAVWPFGLFALTAALAFYLRDVVYEFIVVPLAYALWVAKLYYLVIPQGLKWAVLILLGFVAILWRLIPDASPSPRAAKLPCLAEGPVEALASSILRARGSNYFKWLLANRLGRLARRISQDLAQGDGPPSGDEPLNQYLAAGLNQSFVDFPRRRNRFRRRLATPLDLDVNVVVAHLESQMEPDRDGRPRRI